MLFSWLRNRRRRRLLDEPFPVRWNAILQRNVGHFSLLNRDEQARLRNIIRILITEKAWEGAGGVFVSEEMKVTIAAAAGLLLLGIDHDYYRRVESIVVYRSRFRTPTREDDWEDDELSDFEAEGQAVYRGPVILSWEDVIAESPNPTCGYNVVIHEFAHQLDFLDNTINGTPPLDDPEMEKRWRYVMTVAFNDHRRALKRGGETFFTEHAGENETEFFADATEAFYCNPIELREEYPFVYDLLKAYFRVDPAEWFSQRM